MSFPFKTVTITHMLILIICAAGLLSCNPFSSGGDYAPLIKKEMGEIRQMIHKEIGEARADDESKCKTLAMGAKPCGGPWSYIPYSSQESDEEKLKELADRYFALNRKYNTATGLASDCAYVTEPAVSLVDGHCKIQSSNSTD